MPEEKKVKEDSYSISFPCLKIKQPIGDFYIASINSKDLINITWVDVRRIFKERDIETYLGIQRRLDPKRVIEIGAYTNTVDACFPTAVILAVPGLCSKYDESTSVMTLSNYLNLDEDEEDILSGQIAKVLDGQHRIEGLRSYKGPEFGVNVSLFIDMDVAEQAYIFSTVNLAQTKVSKSLVYDLFDLAKTRSPQKVCHNIAVALDEHEKSPFYKRIKRLGAATEGRFEETITQATFVKALLRYISKTELKELQDRDIYMRRRKPEKATAKELNDVIFRNMMIDEKDIEITDIIFNYFEAVRNRWPSAWNATGKGIILNKTNGFKGLMRFLRDSYLYLTAPGNVPTTADFDKVFKRIDLKDEYFNIDNFKPGTSGESALYRALKEKSGL